MSGFRLRARLGFSIPASLPGPRGITPAFGYSAPHSSAGGTSTLPTDALLSAHYTRVRLLAGLPVGRTAIAFSHRSAAGLRRRCRPGLPVLVHDVSGRARGLRLRRVARGLRVSAPTRVVFAVRYRIDTLEFFFHSSIPGLSVPLFTLRLQPRDWRCKTRGQDGSLLLSCQTLSFLTSCRFIPAHNEPILPPKPAMSVSTSTNWLAFEAGGRLCLRG